MATVTARCSSVLGLHRALRVELWCDRVLAWSEVVDGLCHDPDLRAALGRAIAEAPMAGLFWECAPVSRETRDRPFVCMLIESTAVGRLSTDRRPFARQLGSASSPDVLTFRNRGGGAVLVAPAAVGLPPSHAHLAAFLRGAAPQQIDRLWQAVGVAVQQWWAQGLSPVWVSTSGLGVSWLHVRLDRRAKYYTWTPYRVASR